MNLTIQDGYTLYIKYIDTKLKKYNTKLEEITKDKEYLYSRLIENKDLYSKANIDIDQLPYGDRTKYNSFLIKKYKFPKDKENVLRSYIVAYTNILFLEKICIDSIAQYSTLKVPYSFYRYIFYELNMGFSREILLGSRMDFGFGIGNIYIKEKARDFSKSSACKAINWYQSNKLKAKIIADGNIPYDSVVAPHGIKWQVRYDDDFSYWWWWEYCVNWVSNLRFYKFVPTKFINGDARDKEYFSKHFNTIDKIINTPLLGNIDKLYRILRLNSVHSLNYKS